MNTTNKNLNDDFIIKECNKLVKVIHDAQNLNKMSDDIDKTEASITKFGKRGRSYTFRLNQFKEKQI